MDKRNRTRTVVVILAIAAVVLAGVGIGWWLGRSETETPPPTSTAGPSATTPTRDDVDGVCGLPIGSQDVPQDAPEATWEIRRQLTVPSAPDYGPGKVEGGDRSCFAHNPMGAVFFILNLQGMEAKDQVKHIHGGNYTAESLGNDPQSSDVVTVRGFQVEPKGPDRMEVTVAYGIGSGSLTAIPASVVWVDGDWKLDGEAPDQGSRQITSLDDFVKWGPQ